MLIYRGEHLGTHLHIEASEFVWLELVLEEVKIYLQAFEAKYSRFKVNNWLAQINTDWEGVLDTPAIEMLKVGLELAQLTGGAFDPTITPDLIKIGYGPTDTSRSSWTPPWFKSKKQPETPSLRQSARNNYHDIVLSDSHLTLKNGAQIEFGGIGKGYALEQIANKLSRSSPLIINFGGDIFVRGEATIALENPLNPSEAIGTITLEEWYFCGSSGAYRKIGTHHHLIDGRTGASSQESLASFVQGTSGAWTDGLATAIFVLGETKGIELLEQLQNSWKQLVSGWILTSNGQFFSTENSTIELFI
jgi:FAD:protein FMN transferase